MVTPGDEWLNLLQISSKPTPNFVLSMYPQVFPGERAPDDLYSSGFGPRLASAVYGHNQTQKCKGLAPRPHYAAFCKNR